MHVERRDKHCALIYKVKQHSVVTLQYNYSSGEREREKERERQRERERERMQEEREHECQSRVKDHPVMKVANLLCLVLLVPLCSANDGSALTDAEMSAASAAMEGLGMRRPHLICGAGEEGPSSRVRRWFRKVSTPIRVSVSPASLVGSSGDDVLLCPGLVGAQSLPLSASFRHTWMVLERNSSSSEDEKRWDLRVNHQGRVAYIEHFVGRFMAKNA